jgi:UDP-glucose 4-epimerase
MLDAIRASGTRPLTILASSAAVYGSPAQLPTPESAPLCPESPYGFHKAMAELAGREFAQCYGLPVVALRYFSVFGPRQRRLLVWEIFSQLLHGASELRLKGTGEEQRDFLAEDEAASAAVGLAETLASREMPGEFRAINVASGVGLGVRDVAENICAAAGRSIPIVFGREALPGNPSRWQADPAELRALLPAWTVRPFAKSLEKCVAAWDSGRMTAGAV